MKAAFLRVKSAVMDSMNSDAVVEAAAARTRSVPDVWHIGPIRQAVLGYCGVRDVAELATCVTFRSLIVKHPPEVIVRWARQGAGELIDHCMGCVPSSTEDKAVFAEGLRCALVIERVGRVLARIEPRDYVAPNVNSPDYTGEPVYPPFRVGDVLDVLDTVKKWYEASVLEIADDGHRALVGYHHWNSQWDEWLDLRRQSDRERIAPRGVRAPFCDPSWSPLRSSEYAIACLPGAHPDADTLWALVQRAFPHSAAARAGQGLRWQRVQRPSVVGSYVETRFVKRVAMSQEFSMSALKSVIVDYMEGEQPMWERFLALVARDAVFLLRRVGPPGGLGFQDQKFWNS